MKKLLTLAFVSFSLLSRAQQTSGLITYEQTLSLAIENTKDMPEGLADMLSKPQKTEKVLFFSASAALYENKEKDNKDQSEELTEGDMKINISRAAPEEKTYLDLQAKKEIAEKDLMGRKFLVTGPLNTLSWKMTGRQKKILDRSCMEAFADKGEGDSVTVWYTPDIPVSAGPETLSGLPGMILEAHIGKHLHLLATRIEEDPSGGKKIKEPAKGKKITAEEFERLAKEKSEELKKQYGAGKDGQVIIIRK